MDNLTLKFKVEKPDLFKNYLSKFDMGKINNVLMVVYEDRFETYGVGINSTFFKISVIEFKDIFEESVITDESFQGPCFISLTSDRVNQLLGYFSTLGDKFKVLFKCVTIKDDAQLREMTKNWTDNSKDVNIVYEINFRNSYLNIKVKPTMLKAADRALNLDEPTVRRLTTTSQDKIAEFTLKRDSLDEIMKLIKKSKNVINKDSLIFRTNSSKSKNSPNSVFSIKDAFDYKINLDKYTKEFSILLDPDMLSSIDIEEYQTDLIALGDDNDDVKILVFKSQETDTIFMLSGKVVYN